MKPTFTQFLFVLFLTILNFQGKAQIAIGIKGHISNIGAPLVQTQDFFSKKLHSTLNPGFSILVEYRLNEKMAIQPEIAFRQNRSHYRLQSGASTIHTSVINYARMPLLFKMSHKRNWANLIAFGGPNLGYALGLKAIEIVDSRTHPEITHTKLDFKTYNMNRFELALTLGVGIEKNIAKKFRTSIEFRYDYGITDIGKTIENSYVNRGYALEIGILIPLSKANKK